MLKPEIIAALVDIAGRDYVLTSPEDLVCYSYDGTWLEESPDAVVLPGNTQEVAAIVRLAYREGIILIPRGAASNLSGGTIPAKGGLVLSLGRLNQILEIDTANLVARVQPGVITAVFQTEVEKLGLFYPPDPASLKQSTLGGNVAENSGGPRCLKYGVTSNYVLGLEVVMPTGEICHLGGKVIKNVTGYQLAQLFVGSEGTLGVITEIIVKLIPLPKFQQTTMAVFAEMEEASQAVSDIIAAKIVPASLEFMDQTTLRVVEEHLKMGLPVHAGAVLLVDVDGNDEAAIANETAQVAYICTRNQASEVKTAATAAESAALWAARRSISPSLARMRPNKLGEDISVPRSMIPIMVGRIREIAAKYGLLIPIFGHAGDGNLHPNILFDRRDHEEWERVHAASGEIFTAALELGGTLSGEHGIGLLKKEFLHLDLEPEVIDLMKRLKMVLDPKGIMNPGKIFDDQPGERADHRLPLPELSIVRS